MYCLVIGLCQKFEGIIIYDNLVKRGGNEVRKEERRKRASEVIYSESPSGGNFPTGLKIAFVELWLPFLGSPYKQSDLNRHLLGHARFIA
jgi:hypothetical protein